MGQVLPRPVGLLRLIRLGQYRPAGLMSHRQPHLSRLRPLRLRPLRPLCNFRLVSVEQRASKARRAGPVGLRLLLRLRLRPRLRHPRLRPGPRPLQPPQRPRGRLGFRRCRALASQPSGQRRMAVRLVRHRQQRQHQRQAAARRVHRQRLRRPHRRRMVARQVRHRQQRQHQRQAAARQVRHRQRQRPRPRRMVVQQVRHRQQRQQHQAVAQAARRGSLRVRQRPVQPWRRLRGAVDRYLRTYKNSQRIRRLWRRPIASFRRLPRRASPRH